MLSRILQHKYFKLAVIFLLLALSIYQFVEGNIGNGIFLIFLAFLVFFLFLRNEYMLLASLRMRKDDLEGAEKWLAKIQRPEEALIKPQLASYYLMQGMIQSRKNVNLAEKYLRKALKTGLILKQEQAVAKLSLAGVLAAKRRKREALHLLNEAKKLDKKGLLKENIQFLKKQLKRI
ncbi:MAG: DUF2892 domain-containing protein [Chlorobi bacterium]|nr:DUF2892 domain-containing protein [Chlorobiota bacterium]